MKRRHWRIGILLSLCVVYFVAYSTWEFQIARTASALQDSPPTIIVDAGHGGEDGGATSVTGARESDLNLSISLKLEQLLAFCGMKPKMIRSEDVSVSTQGATIRERKRSDLNNRVDIINHTNRSIFLSIHQNHFAESRYSGAQVFYANTSGSKQLAQKTQDQLRNVLDSSNTREIKRAESVYIMRKINCAGILVECGFLSNPREEALIRDGAYQRKLSCAICCALAQYLEEGEMDVEI